MTIIINYLIFIFIIKIPINLIICLYYSHNFIIIHFNFNFICFLNFIFTFIIKTFLIKLIIIVNYHNKHSFIYFMHCYIYLTLLLVIHILDFYFLVIK